MIVNKSIFHLQTLTCALSIALSSMLFTSKEAHAQECIEKCNDALALDIRENLETKLSQEEYSRLVTHYCDEVSSGSAGSGNLAIAYGDVSVKGGESSSSERYRKLCKDYDSTKDMKYASELASAYIVPGNLKTVHDIYKTCMAAPECGDGLDLTVEEGAGDGRFVRLWVTWHKRNPGPNPLLKNLRVDGKANCVSASFATGERIPVGVSSIQCTRTDNSRSVVHVTMATSRGERSTKFGSPCVSAGCSDNNLQVPDGTRREVITASSSYERVELGSGSKLLIRDDLPHMKSKITLEIHHLILPKSGSGAFIGLTEPTRFLLSRAPATAAGTHGGHGAAHDRPQIELIVHRISLQGSGRRPTPTELASSLSINFDGIAGGNGGDGAKGTTGAQGAPGTNGRHSCDMFGCECTRNITDGGPGHKGGRGGNGGNAGRGGHGANVLIVGPFNMGELLSSIISNRGGQPGIPGRPGAGGNGGPGGPGGSGGGGHCGNPHSAGPQGPQGDAGDPGQSASEGMQGTLKIKEEAYR